MIPFSRVKVSKRNKSYKIKLKNERRSVLSHQIYSANIILTLKNQQTVMNCLIDLTLSP